MRVPYPFAFLSKGWVFSLTPLAPLHPFTFHPPELDTIHHSINYPT
jgi:hypothetical protein